jgi:acetolactate synthase-1/3 small subunit
MKIQQSAKHIIVATVDNNPGVVSRISGLFTRRGYNIESLVTGVTENPAIYKLVIAVIATEEETELFIRQLGRIMEVVEVRRADGGEFIIRELMFIRVLCPAALRSEVIKTADVMRLEIAGVGADSIVVQVTGDGARLESALRSLEPFGIVETIRSGAVAIGL